MMAVIGWGAGALTGSALLMVLVLMVRAPVRQLVGPRLAYGLWALPAIRIVLPALPVDVFAALPAGPMSVLVTGPQSVSGAVSGLAASSPGTALLLVWCTGAFGVFTVYAIRHWRFCRRLRAGGSDFGLCGTIRIIAADVSAPLAFGVLRRFIAVPRDFARDYAPAERDLALAHEAAHHARGDLRANWLSLAVLAAHWWNPVAWAAMRAFRQDQEFAADAAVLTARAPAARRLYARVLAKAAGIGALPACNLNAHSNLKGRLIMLNQKPRSKRRLVSGAAGLVLVGSAALAATAATPGGTQATTIGVKPDGAGSYALIVGGAAVAPGAALPGGMALPADFAAPAGCDLKPSAKAFAMVIKGAGGTQTYTVMCASAAPAPLRATLAEGLISLQTMRASVATQPASAAFPESERAHALGAIDRSIDEIEAGLAGKVAG